jgi:hypothetical protein
LGCYVFMFSNRHLGSVFGQLLLTSSTRFCVSWPS